MAQMRETPYAAFNFLVELQPGQGKEVQAGFSEVSGLNAEVTVAEYRAGNSTVNYVHKLPGIHKAGDVTLKRGVIGAQNLYEWLEASRSGRIKDAKREIVIKLLSEDRADTVVSWKLRGAVDSASMKATSWRFSSADRPRGRTSFETLLRTSPPRSYFNPIFCSLITRRRSEQGWELKPGERINRLRAHLFQSQH